MTVEAVLRSRLREISGDLLALSHDLHAHPELAFAEHRSAAALARLARARGLPVTVGAGGLPTAFVGEVGTGPPVALLCEYDALPGLGHGCGHNVVAAAGLGAALLLAPMVRELGGAVRLVGTPAEEAMGGGKVRLARAGVFRGARAALMVHPGVADVAQPATSAARAFTVTVKGRSAHASMAPEKGINALDGLIGGYTAMTALRPSLPAGSQVSAVLRSGGEAPNIVPDRAVADVLVRAGTSAPLELAYGRIADAYRGAARAVGAWASVQETGIGYQELLPAPDLALRFRDAARAVGRDVALRSDVPVNRAGSTDIGNLSHLLPCLQPHLAIAPPSVASHSHAFAAAAASAAGDRAALDGALALALTAVQLLTRRARSRP